MKIEKNEILKNLDQVLDYVPILSTITNLIDIIQKKVFIDKQEAKSDAIVKNRYYQHLHGKDIKRCVMLLIPFVGNIIVALGLLDKKAKEPKAEIPEQPKAEVPEQPKAEVPEQPKAEVPEQPIAEIPEQPIAEVPEESKNEFQINNQQKEFLEIFKNADQLASINYLTNNNIEFDENLILSLLRHDLYKMLLLQSIGFGNKEIVQELLETDEFSNREYLLKQISINGLLLEYLPKYNTDPEFVTVAVKNNIESIKYVLDPKMVLLVLKNNREAYKHINTKIKTNDFIIQALKQDGLLLENLNKVRQNKPAYVQAAFKQNPDSLRFASPAMQERFNPVNDMPDL